MKNIWNKIYIHPTVYFVVLSACITGMFKELIILSVIIAIHELGHILLILIYKHKLQKVEFFPFGGLIKYEKDINSPLNEEILTSCAGVMMQIILGLLVFILFNFNLIRYQVYYLFSVYNMILICFNLLPIIPLDGHLFLKSILELYLPYKDSFIVTTIISLIVLAVLIIVNISFNLNNYIILGFLLYKIFEALKRFKYNQIRFYLERLIKDYKYSKVKIIMGIRIDRMFKERTHYFLEKDNFLPESKVLAKKFDMKKNF